MTEPSKLHVCPECQSDAVVDHECFECEGLGIVLDENDNEDECQNCEGAGTIADQLECSECGHVYEESDL